MRLPKTLKTILLTFTSFLFLLGCAAAQNEDENVRGAFLTSRPAGNTTTTARKRRTRHKKRPAQDQANIDSPGNNSSGTISNSAGTSSSSAGTSEASKLAPIGVGYTIYMRNSRGEAVRVDPSRQFHAKDSIRLSLESNTDGYLYVFHTENGSSPEMIFPDKRLIDGNNEIDAHVPIDVPSTRETEERFRWFTFDKNPATERLYIVVTREPLAGVPTDEDLVSYCSASGAICPWHPPAPVWAQMMSDANGQTVVSKSKTYGQAETASERDATSRGLGLGTSAPSPSVIRMSATSTAPLLVTALDLVHKE